MDCHKNLSYAFCVIGLAHTKMTENVNLIAKMIWLILNANVSGCMNATLNVNGVFFGCVASENKYR